METEPLTEPTASLSPERLQPQHAAPFSSAATSFAIRDPPPLRFPLVAREVGLVMGWSRSSSRDGPAQARSRPQGPN